MTFAQSQSATGTAVQSGVSVMLFGYLRDSITLMLPFCIAAVALIVVDLFFGVPAARKRGEKVTLSRCLRLTINKFVEYVCWIILAATLAVSFQFPSLNWIILSLVVGNEVISIVTNYFYLHGKRISGLESVLFGWLGSKIDADTSGVTVEDIREEKKNNNNLSEEKKKEE